MKLTAKLKYHYENFPVIETDNLILRGITADDAADLCECISNPEMYKYWGADLSKNEMDASKYIRRNLSRKPPNGITWGIVLKESAKLVGEIFINSIEDNRLAHIGYRVTKSYWGRGIATEATKAVVKFTFEETELQKLYTHVINGNDGSCKVLEKCGFTKEGFIREGKLFRNYCNFSLYGYIKSDFKLEE